MAQYQYIASDSAGAPVSGVLAADSRQAALLQLSDQGLFPVEVQSARSTTTSRHRVSASALAGMYQLLADLLDSGVALLKSIDVLTEQTADESLRSILQEVRNQVADGRPLAAAMQEHQSVFGDLAISMVHAGEEGGFLEDSLTRLARLTERQEELKGRVLGALAYPAFLLIVGFVVVVGMVVFFVPEFEPMFDRMRDRGELPLLTSWLLGVSGFLRDHGIWPALGAVAAVIWVAARSQTEQFQSWWDGVQLRVRGIGPILRGLAIARFCRVLGTMLSNGVPLLRSLDVARGATGNRVLSRAIGDAADNISSGNTLAAPLAASGQFPRELIEMISVGEQANRLESVLIGIADKLESKTQRRLDVLVKLLEPAMMLVMAVVIGCLIVALLTPVFAGSGALG